MRRVLGISLALVIVLAHGTEASGPWSPNANGDYQQIGENPPPWRFYDTNCTSSSHFQIKLYEDTGWSGDWTWTCTYEDQACYVPLTWEGLQPPGCGIEASVNDEVSSIGVVDLGYTWDVCLYADGRYMGSWIRLTSDGDDRSSLSGFNDRISSWRKRHDGAGTSTYEPC